MNSKISVVIPSYNSEKYIGHCLETIQASTYKNLEIIVVNDGSTDSSPEIIAEKMKNDSRIICIDQENGGEFSARNTGILAATGQYIGFVDSDDYIAADMYEKLLDAILKENADMAVCNFNLVYEDERETSFAYANMPHKMLNVQDDVYEYWTKVCAISKPNNYVWTRLYKSEVIKNSGVMFENYPHSADTLFNFKLLPHLKNVAFVNEGLYFYLQRKGSGIHTIANKRNIAELYADTFQELSDYYENNSYEEFYKILPLHAFTRLRSIFFYSRLAGKTDDEIISLVVDSWKNRDIFKYLVG